MSKFEITESSIDGVATVRRWTARDSRGDFSRLYCEDEFKRLNIFRSSRAVQTNLSRTRGVGVVRGLHLQIPPSAEHKLVTCLAGSVWDVAVDLRAQSLTFGCWAAFKLSADEDVSVLLPPGVAHGFQTLEPDVTLLYMHSDNYRADLDAGVAVDDPELAINWPLRIRGQSVRDLGLPTARQFRDEVIV